MEDEYDLASDDAPVDDEVSLEETDLDFEDPEMDLQEGDADEENGDEVDGEEPDTEEPETVEEAEPQAMADDAALVTLQDGRQISVGELKRNNLFQQDYTRKTEHLKQQVEEFHNTRTKQSENFQAHADAIMHFASQIIPEPSPQLANEDPVAYMQEKARFDQLSSQYGQILEAAKGMKAEAAARLEAEKAERIRDQQEILKTRMPELADPVKHREFVNDAIAAGRDHYGFTAEDLGQIDNHAHFLVLKDALAFRKLQSQGNKTRQMVASKPKMKTRPRSSEKSGSNRAAMQRLARSGSIRDAMAIDFE